MIFLNKAVVSRKNLHSVTTKRDCISFGHGYESVNVIEIHYHEAKSHFSIEIKYNQESEFHRDLKTLKDELKKDVP